MRYILKDYSQIINGIDAVLYVVDSEYNIQYCNNEVASISGRHPDELINKKCYNALFGYAKKCRECPINNGELNTKNAKFNRDVVVYNGELHSYITTIRQVSDNIFVESLVNATELVQGYKQSNYRAKLASTENILMLEEKSKLFRHNKFLDTAFNSMQQGLLIVSPDYRIIKINKSLQAASLVPDLNHTDVKCYEVYGFSEPCSDCPFNNKGIDKSHRQMRDASMTVVYSSFDKYLVESLRDTSREIKLIDEIRTSQVAIQEKQRQMRMLNEDLLRMNEQLKHAQAVIDEDLKQVARIQHSLLPNELPQVEGYDFSAFYLPAEFAGGDYYDFINMSNNYMGLLVADVSGHGTPAAVIMAITRALMRSYTSDLVSSSEALAVVNEILCDNIETNDFVTMFYSVLNSAMHKINYASAGHNPVLMFDKSEFIVKKLNAGGMFLGSFAGLDYEEKEVELEEGDIFFMYTDGLVEAMDDKREQYGYDRLISKLMMFSNYSCERIIDEIMTDVKSFADNKFEDDVTIFVIKREKS